MDELQSYLTSIFMQKKFESAIDIGCAYGENTKFLNILCPTVGIDISGEYVRKARKKYPGIKFIVGDIRTYKFRKKFDVAITHGLLIHVHPKNIRSVIKKILKIASRAIFVESSVEPTYQPNRVMEYNAKEYWEHRARHPKQNDDLPMQYYYKHDYESLFDELGIGYQMIKEFDPKTKTRMYYTWLK